MKKQSRKVFLLFLLLMSVVCVQAQIRLPKVIGSNMVLQQQKEVAIWGTAASGQAIRVQFGKQTQRTKADANGQWQVKLQPMKANWHPQRMVISSGKERVVLTNILVGEVWLASGQSNMEYTMQLRKGYQHPYKGVDVQQQEMDKANCPLMRMLYVEKNLKTDSLPSKGWQEINKESLGQLSAPAYFFAKNLIDSLNVPVGILSSSWGGTSIEVWTPGTGDRFERMVREMIPFTLRGFLWYQGESNLMRGHFEEYTEKQKVLVNAWRKLWKDDALPFYYVQISPYLYSPRRGDAYVNTWEGLPRFWEAQEKCLEIPYSGMVVTTDLVDDLKDIHPSYKWEVGRRLALWALAKDYGRKNLVYSGPRYQSMQIRGDQIVLTFEHIGGGLTTNDGKSLSWFQIAGEKGRFVKAEAVIEGSQVIVSSPKVPIPARVRFAWDETARPNLCNKEGLPAWPFRTK